VPSRGCHGEATTVEERLRLALSALADKSVCHRFCQHHYKCWNDAKAETTNERARTYMAEVQDAAQRGY
jgi:hypothetical protein